MPFTMTPIVDDLGKPVIRQFHASGNRLRYMGIWRCQRCNGVVPADSQQDARRIHQAQADAYCAGGSPENADE